MKKIFFLISAAFIFSADLAGQSFSKYVDDAFLVRRMAEKYHVQPRTPGISFSADFLSILMNGLDEEKTFFTSEDLKILSGYKIDTEINNRKSDFLNTLHDICIKRLPAIEQMINEITGTSFNFSKPEFITREEDTSFAANEKGLYLKLIKNIKRDVLYTFLNDDDFLSKSKIQQTKFIDSAEAAVRQKIKKQYINRLNMVFRGAGTMHDALGVSYCKSLAEYYDPHTAYLPLSEKENLEGALGNNNMAFGFGFKDDNGLPKIDKIEPGSPVFKSGQINQGDRILSVQWGDGQPIDVSMAGMDELRQALRLSNHEKATFKIQKPDGSERIIVLYKEENNQDDDKVKSFLLKGPEGTIGFISLPAFYQDWDDDDAGIKGCTNDVAKEILKLKKENIQGLILDLRYNGGGSVQEAVDMAGLFIDAGPVAQFKDRDSKAITLKDTNRGSVWDGPLIVMVNRYSASASEMIAAALQDYNRALIVGTQTFGKATAQVIMPLDTAVSPVGFDAGKTRTSFIKLTVSELYRVTGMTVQAIGVTPDIVLPDPYEVFSESEASLPHKIVSKPIEANKYFAPLHPLDISRLKMISDSITGSSVYFSHLKKYMDSISKHDISQPVSLQFPDDRKQRTPEIEWSDLSVAEQEKRTAFVVENNQYDLQQLKYKSSLMEANGQWKTLLEKDPYLNVSYRLILNMK